MALYALLLALTLALLPVAAAAQQPLDTATKALFQAVELNDMTGVEKSLAAGADIAAHNAQGQTPADLAVARGHFKIAHFLLSKRTAAKQAPPASPATTATEKTPAAAAPATTSSLPPPPATTASPMAAAPPTIAAATPKPTSPSSPPPQRPRIATLPPESPSAPPAAPKKPSPAAPASAHPTTAKSSGAAPPAVAEAPASHEAPSQPTKKTAAAAEAKTATQKKKPGFWSKVVDAITPWFLKGGNNAPAPAATPETPSSPSSAPPSSEAAGTTGRMMQHLGSLVGGKQQQEDIYGLPNNVAITPPAEEPAAVPRITRAEGPAAPTSPATAPGVAESAQAGGGTAAPPTIGQAPAAVAPTGEAATPPAVEPAPATTSASSTPAAAANLPPPPASPAPATSSTGVAANLPPPPSGATSGLPTLPKFGSTPASPPSQAAPASTTGNAASAANTAGLPKLPKFGATPASPPSGTGAAAETSGLPALPPLPKPTPGVPTQIRKPLETPSAMASAASPPAVASPASPSSSASQQASGQPAPSSNASDTILPAPAPTEAPAQSAGGKQQLPQKIAIPDQPMVSEKTTAERIGQLSELLDRQIKRNPAEILKQGRKLADANADEHQTLRMPTESELKREQVPTPPTTKEAAQEESQMVPPKKKPEAKGAGGKGKEEGKAAQQAAATPPLPSSRPSPRVGPRANQVGSPASRLLDRLTGNNKPLYTMEDHNGLPPISASGEASAKGETPAEKKKIDTLASFFTATEPALGVRNSKEIRREELPAPDPGIIDTLKHEPNAALDQTVPDSMLDLKPYEKNPSAGDQLPPPQHPSSQFMEKLAEVLTPKGLPVAKPMAAGDANGQQNQQTAGVGLKQLDVPADQLKTDLSVTDQPWTMTVEKPSSDGGDKTLSVQAIDPNSGKVKAKKPGTGIVSGMMNKVKHLFASGDAKAKKQQAAISLSDNQRLQTAEQLLTDALRAERPSTPPPAEKGWQVTNVQVASNQPDRPGPPPQNAMGGVPLVDVTLALGQSVTLSNTSPPVQKGGSKGTDPTNTCIKKNHGTTLFCIVPVDWPASVSQEFLVPTILYTGLQAVVRYDQGSATRFHALFSSDKYDDVVSYYQKRYGEPTDIWKRSIAPLAKPRMADPTVAWRSRDSKTNAVTVLEIRKYDDTRGGFPDTTRGAVMLYYQNAPTIFPQVSSHELMRLRDRFD